VTAIVVEDETVVTPQVPLAGDNVTTAPAAKLVPAIANDVVALAAPEVGVTEVMVGAAPMFSVAAVPNAADLTDPPSVLEIVKPSEAFVSVAAMEIVPVIVVAVTAVPVNVTPASATPKAFTKEPTVAPVLKPVPVMVTGTFTAPAPIVLPVVPVTTIEATVGSGSSVTLNAGADTVTPADTV
jgi:hypothetical protein